MEKKKRTLFAVLIATIIVVAVFSSFAINLFNREDYEIKLPDLSSDSSGDPSGNEDDYGNQFVRVELTPETVQNVVEKTLSRPKSYYREISIELWANEEDPSVTTAQVWVDDGWTRTDVVLPNGKVQHNLVGDETHWVWYDEEKNTMSFPEGRVTADLVQHIPTYEDVLELSTKEITETGYEKYSGADCIYVEVEQKELGSHERYWIAVADGLLVGAERVKGDQLLYRMTSSTTESPAPIDSNFGLPDGTVLHSVAEG